MANLKIRDKVTINARHFTSGEPQKGVISKVVKTSRLDTGLFTLGLLHFHNTASLSEDTTYTVVREIPAHGDQIRMVFGEYEEKDLTKGWSK